MSSKVASPWGAAPAAPAQAPLSFAEVLRDAEAQSEWEKSVNLAAELQRAEYGEEDETVAPVDDGDAADPDAAFAAAAAGADAHGETSDFELALALQRQFNDEHDAYINEAESLFNKQHGGGRVRVSLDRFRAAYPEDASNAALLSRPVESEDGASEDEIEPFADEPLSYHQGTRTMRNASGQIVTKHDADRASNRYKQQMTDSLPLSFPCGDMGKGTKGGKGGKGGGRVPNHVYNRLQAFANKTEKQRQRVTEKKDTSTSDMAIDAKTRLLLFRLINAKIIDQVNGAISSGKEAAVFHATRHADPDDPESEIKEVAVKVFKTVLTEFKQRQQFLHGDRRVEDRVGRQSARKLVKLWAEKESANLVRMARAGVPCPEVVLQHKHVLLLGFIGDDGVAAPKLKDVRFARGSARRDALEQARRALRTMYNGCRIVHADLSEYNMLYHNKTVYVIDVGQGVETSHPRAKEYLYRDCVNVCSFFTKIGEESTPTPQALYAEVTGEAIADDDAAQYKERINSSRRAPKQHLAGTETYMLGLCDLSDAADPGPAFPDPFTSGVAAAAAAAGGGPAASTGVSNDGGADGEDGGDEGELSSSEDDADDSALRAKVGEAGLAAAADGAATGGGAVGTAADAH